MSDSEILERLNQARQNVDQALCDDFNTSAAMNEILDLVTFVNKSVKKRERNNESFNSLNMNYGSLMAVNEFIQTITSNFGLNISGTHGIHSSTSEKVNTS